MKPAVLFVFAIGLLNAQVPNPTQEQTAPAVATAQPAPVFRVTVVSRSVPAINYHHRSGSTRVDFHGTELLPQAKGDARVDSRMGSTKIDAHFDKMSPATQFGPEYLTYVMWAITPEGRSVNLGEVVLDGDKSSLLATTSLQAFGLLVTAEPYFAVTQPSDVVVMENFVRKDTAGTIQTVDAKYHLLRRGTYVLDRSAYTPVSVKPKGPLQLAEAENAVQIAKLAGAERYAADTLKKAEVELGNARDSMNGKNPNAKFIETTARAAAQAAEDARVITYRKMEEERQAAQKAATVQARQEAAQQTAVAQQAETERAAAEQAKAEAQAAAAHAAAERTAAEQAKAEAVREQQQALNEADRAKAEAHQATNEREQMRERLRQQLSTVMETRETARGLIVNISDVLFDFGKYTLKPDAREKLAKVSGILLAYPGLSLRLEGHTDAVGSDAYNLKLSQDRADNVRAYLVQQGVSPAAVIAVGMGKADPVAPNDNAAGRQQNRRVELVVSGESIGVPNETNPGQPAAPANPQAPAAPQAPPPAPRQ